MPKYIDIHCHVNFKMFKEDGDVVIRRALEADTWLVNVGSQYTTSKRAVEIANKYSEGVYACIGLHPIHLEESFHDSEEIGPSFAEATDGQGVNGFFSHAEVFDKEKYLELAKDPKVVAIGECGLDYFHMDEASIEKQKKAFITQIEFANEVGKPLMLHIRNNPEDTSRNAYLDTCELLKKYAKVKGVSHFFAGSVEDMKRFVALGYYVSFAGPITFKPNLKICDYIKVIQETPLNMILTDTDSPYVAPMPYRGKRNEPSYVCEIIKKIAEIKKLPEQDVAKAIIANAKRLFGI